MVMVNGITSGVSLRKITSILISMVNMLSRRESGRITAQLPLTLTSVDAVSGMTAETFSPGLMDEVMIFHSALEQEDIQELADKGYQNYLAVDPEGKLGTTWGHIKATHHLRE